MNPGVGYQDERTVHASNINVHYFFLCTSHSVVITVGPMTTSSIQDRVHRGAALLDAKFPGWVNDVNLTTLNLATTCDCILGQKFGDFSAGSRITGLAIETSSVPLSDGTKTKLEEHGFLVNVRGSECEMFLDVPVASHRENARIDREYVALTQAWTELITDRRLAAHAAEATESELVSA